MLHIAFIGTGFIVENFAAALHQLPQTYVLDTLYSRSEKKAKDFAQKLGFSRTQTSLTALADDPAIDAVYIASPNTCHFEQAALMLRHGKHVICEKPLATTRADEEKLFALAKENHVILIEAMRPAFDPSTKVVRDNLARLGAVRRLDFSFCQYSSRYDLLKQGTVTNIFDPKMCGGAAYDIGIYPIYYLAMIMGMPEQIQKMDHLLENGAVGCGTILARYPEAIASVSYSKINDSDIVSTIQGEHGYLAISKMNDPNRITFCDGKGHEEVLYERPAGNNMVYEAEAFADMIAGNLSPDIYEQYSLTAISILTAGN